MAVFSDSIRGRTGKRDARTLFAFPRRYGLRYISQILLYLFFILLLIEGIFLSEELIGILNRLFGALGSQAHMSDVLLVLATRTPEVFDLAMPTALLVAVYRVSLHCREDREFLVIAGMGIGAPKLISLAVLVGLAAQLAALTVSGIVEPGARFAQRSIFFNAAFRALRDGSSSGKLYFLTNHVVYSVPQSEPAPGQRVFVHESRRSGTDRVIVAERAQLEGPDQNGQLTISMQDMTVDEFQNRNAARRAAAARQAANSPPCNNCEAPPKSAPTNSVFVKDLAQKMTPDEIIRFEPRGRSPSEWTSLELLGIGQPPGAFTSQHIYEIGHRIARSLLCLVAPLLAGVALTFTTRTSQPFVLPLACATLMAFDVACTAIAKSAVDGGVWAILTPTFLLFAALVALLAQQLIARQHALVVPAQAKA